MKAVQNSLYQMIYCTTKTPNIFKSGRVLCSIVIGGAWYKVYHPSSIRALTFRGKTMANRSVLNLLDQIDYLFRDWVLKEHSWGAIMHAARSCTLLDQPTQATSCTNTYIIAMETIAFQACMNLLIGNGSHGIGVYIPLFQGMYIYTCDVSSWSIVAYVLHIFTYHIIPCVHAYLLTTNVNGRPIAGHYLHLLHVIISWVSFTSVDPSGDDGRGRREAWWTLHEQPPNTVAGESGFSALYSRGNPLAYITLELGLHIIEAKLHIN